MIRRVLVVAVLSALLAPGVATAADRVPGTLALYREPTASDPGLDLIFDSDRFTLNFDGTGWTSVNVGGRQGFTVSFLPSDFNGLRRGPYGRASGGVGRPSLSLDSDRYGCSPQSGRFEVREWSVSPSGRLRRAWILFETVCSSGPLIGELRLGSSRGAAVPAIVRWPTVDLGLSGMAVPVRLARGRVTGASISGSAAKDFALVRGDCGGCAARVRFTPTAVGLRTAALHLRTTRGGRITVPLQAFAYGGLTALDMTTEPSGATRHYDITANWRVFVGEHGISGSAGHSSDDYVGFAFEPLSRQTLVPGTYTMDADYLTSMPYISIETPECPNTEDGAFTVHSLTPAEAFDDHSPTTIVDFDQQCFSGSATRVRGTIQYRAGDQTRPAHWMSAGIPPARPNALLPSTFAIETRMHQIAARRFKADTKDLHHLVNFPYVGTPMDMLRNNLRRYQQLLQRLPPSDRSLKARRRTWQRKLARETKLLDALVTAMADGVDRKAKRARTRLLRELS